MKTTIKALFVAFILLVATSVYAQKPTDNQPNRRPTPEQMMAKMKTDLSLTDAQVAKIKALDVEVMAKMKGENADRAAIAKERVEKMKKILTPEQNKKWEQMKKAMMDKHKERQNAADVKGKSDKHKAAKKSNKDDNKEE